MIPLRISTLATQMYPKSRFKSRRCLGLLEIALLA